MVKRGIKFAFMLLAAGMMVFLSISPGTAFQAVSVGDTELEVYGFLRNNFGYFLENQDWSANGDGEYEIATNRTWLRVNVDWEFSDNFSFFAAGQLVYEPEYDIEEGSVSKPDGKEYSEYDDINDVLREAYFDWSPNANHNFRIGRQIVIWGESMSTQVGDIVNPLNNRFTFAFANWEDTRIPLWMVKGLHYFDSLSSSLEWLFSPNLVGEEYRVNRSGDSAQPGAGEFVQQRFALYQETRHLPPYAVGNPGLPPDFSPYVTTAPISRGWNYIPFRPGNGWGAFEIPNVVHEFPEENDYKYGFRTSTFLGGYEFGVSYYHTQVGNPVLRRTDETFPSGIPNPQAPQTIRTYVLEHPDVDYYGVYFNKDVKVGLIRAEAIYSPNMTFKTLDLDDFDALVERDYYKYMIAWDISGALYFDWHKSAPIDIAIEHYAEYVPDNDLIQKALYGEEIDAYKPSFGVTIKTNWLYNLIDTKLITAYNVKSKSGLFMPVVTWQPTWKDRTFSMELRYIGIFGEDNYSDLGMFKQKDMIVLTTQFNF